MSIQDFTRKSLDKNGEWYSNGSFLQKKPGGYYKYSGVASTLAAVIIELVEEMPYSTFTTKYILDPLEMFSAGWFFEDVNLDQYSQLYTSSGKLFPLYNYINYPTGQLIVSVNDLGKFLSELIKGYSGKGILLGKASYGELFGESPEKIYDSANNSAFLKMDLTQGIFMGRTQDGYFGHTGAAPGVIAIMFFNMDSKIGRILFINTRVEPEDIKIIWNIWDLLDEYEEKLAVQDVNL